MTRPWVWPSIRVFTASLLVAIFAVPQSLLAQVHVVSATELQQQVLESSHERQKNLAIVLHFLSSPTAQKAMSMIHTDANQVKIGVSRLNDQELARLAQRAQKTEANFAAGGLSDRDLLIILLAVLVLVVIILAAEH
jgi:hypothetical protein